MHQIKGQLVDESGRCVHYASSLDIVANKCQTCQAYYACYKCHEELEDHPFGRMDTHLDDSCVLCCACGLEMPFSVYDSVSECPKCHEPFNPACRLHRSLYFL